MYSSDRFSTEHCTHLCTLQQRMDAALFSRKFGTMRQKWDLIGTNLGLWSQLGLPPKFGTSLKALQYDTAQGCEAGKLPDRFAWFSQSGGHSHGEVQMVS